MTATAKVSPAASGQSPAREFKESRNHNPVNQWRYSQAARMLVNFMMTRWPRGLAQRSVTFATIQHMSAPAYNGGALVMDLWRWGTR